MADPTPSDDGTRAMPSGSGPKSHTAAGSAELPAKIGRYEVRELLGEGAFGRVFLAFDPRLNRPVAIKLPKPDGFTDDMRERFVREAWATATIHHPNVCPVFDVGDEGDVPYIVMHYQPGGTLGGHLDRWKVLPPQQAVALAQKLALGMAAAHERGVIHRDLKPANVLYDPSKHLALITDFGLARIGTRAGATAVGAVFGTPLYMSPEQARGETDAVGPHSDVYSLGVILYRMLTGAVPFDGSVYEILLKHNQDAPVPPSQARRGLDPRLDALVLKAMAKRPADRYPGAKAFADALADYARSAETVAGGWSKATLMDPAPSSAAVPAVPAPVSPLAPPPLPPRPAGKSNPPVPPAAPPKPAGKSTPPAVPPRAPAVPLPPPRPPAPPPRGALDRPADDGAIRQKVLLIGGGLLLALMAVATVAILATSKTQPTVATVEPVPNPPAPPAPKKEDPPAEKKDPVPPKKERPAIANNFAGHAFDAAAERRAAEWVLAQGGGLKVKPATGDERAVTNAAQLPAGDFRVTRLDLKDKPNLPEADIVAHLTGLSGPVEVSFTECRLFGDEAMRAVAGIPELTALATVLNPNVTNDGLAAIARHPHLTAVDVRSTTVDRAGLAHLATLPKVRRLTLAVPGTDDFLPDLAPLADLERLQLFSAGPRYLTPRGLAHLKPFGKLKRLFLYGRGVTDEWLKPLLDVGLPALEELDLSESGVTGPGLVHLKDFPRVDWVALNLTSVRDEGLAHVGAARRVKWVSLVGTTVGDDGLRGLVKNPGLRWLDLQDNKKVTDAGVALLAGCEDLEHLDLTGTAVGDAGAKALVACKSLKRLILTGTPVTVKGVEDLRKALPNCTVTHLDAKPAAGGAIDPKKLAGKWERQGATSKGYFWEFADGKLMMGFGDAKASARAYTVEGDKLVVEGVKDGAKVTYTITKLTDDEFEVRYASGTTYTHKKVPPAKKP
jgi:serine/threonine-protein kinase